MLVCRDCNEEFTFTEGEQQFFSERGFSEPIRCKACRDLRKAQKSDRAGSGYGGDRGGHRNRW
ncbi:MAG: zinc-ribbon domain containing protein [Armatimonadetes bacterium]|nr:zinc-ribbon domain containing protein [Armatimonadota bacterium]